MTDPSCFRAAVGTVCILWYVRSDRDQSGRADERECLTMEESCQLLWQAQWGELILVPLQQAHLLPATHKSLNITPCCAAAAANTAGPDEAWLEGLEATRLGVSKHKRVVQDVKYIRLSFGLCLGRFHLPHIYAGHSCRQGRSRGALTLRGVSSTSDKGQRDSHTARVHTAQPAAGMTAPHLPSLAAQNKILDTKSAITHGRQICP